MDDIQAQMGAILGNPDMMQKIMAMAQTLNQSAPAKEDPDPPQKQETKAADNPGFSLPDIDLGMIQRLSGFAKQSGIDSNQKNLLNALGPYLSRERISKLEKAMQAAKMAKMASSFLGKAGLSLGPGR